MAAGNGAIPRRDLVQVGQPEMAGLNFERPTGIVIKHEGRIRDVVGVQDLASERLEFAYSLLDLAISGTLRAIVVQDTVPVLLRSKSRRVPAKVINPHRAVRNGLISP